MAKRQDLLADDETPDGATLAEALAFGPSTQQIVEALRLGFCPTDSVFDRFLPYELRVVSGQYWTPLIVARRAAQWLSELDVATVVDIGSGAGKFCVVGALTGRCRFIGLEQRPRLVAAARSLARRFQVDERVRFIEGSLGDITAPVADAYYLYNPFGENLYGPIDHLDETVELGPERYARDIAVVEDLFARAAIGTYVLTYNGFGGRMPVTYQQVRVDRSVPNVLRLWRKTHQIEMPSAAHRGSYVKRSR